MVKMAVMTSFELHVWHKEPIIKLTQRLKFVGKGYVSQNHTIHK